MPKNTRNIFARRPRMRWIVLSVTVALSIFALWEINNISTQIRHSEKQKVSLWAQAISQKARLVSYSDEFFRKASLDEYHKMRMYTDILQSFNTDQAADMRFSLAYVNYIVDSCKTDLIITDADGYITVPQQMSGQRLRGDMLAEFSKNPPFHYTIWGMPMTLYYKESQTYRELRHVLDGFMQSFLSEITNNSVFVPVVITDNSMRCVLGYGNLDESSIDTPDKLGTTLRRMQHENQPIAIPLPDKQRAYVFYESTPLLKALDWVPLLYVFILLVLVLISYNLFRTARDMEQNRIWVGLAKETAHQLGTPISSLIAWNDYLEGKTLDEKYTSEIRKDLARLETITHRFSKIGSVPELKEENVCEVIENAISYLKTRSPRKIEFQTVFPDEDVTAPINRYLFEWVIENLCKNAIDAMEGSGIFSVIVSDDSKQIFIDVSDTGKGIPASAQKHIFESGYTTKQRGWGLGLSLAKRIIDEYHHGRIFLKYSVVGQGTVFRIVLKKGNPKAGQQAGVQNENV